MLSKLDEFQIHMKMNANYMPEEYEMDLFHYTSPMGFTSILFGDNDKTTLWASRYDCLNDASEGTVAESVFKEVCLDLKERGEISDYLYTLFSSVSPARTILLNKQECDKIKISRPECNRYICSFSKNKDSLVMWNYYSKGNRYEGFNIGFYPSIMKESLDKFLCDKEAIFHVYPVVYDKKEQMKMIVELLMKLKEHYSKDQETSIRYIISNRLLDWSLVFKNECFKHEEEVRIIVDVAKREKTLPVKYRISSGYVVPYIELKLEKEDVSYANFGPLQCSFDQKNHQVQVMEDMISDKGYSALVEYSKIPVRY